LATDPKTRGAAGRRKRLRCIGASVFLSPESKDLFTDVDICSFVPSLSWQLDPKTAWQEEEPPSFAKTGSVQTINENVIQNEQKALRFHLLSKNKTGRARGVQGALPNN
jgi:hypothetical protein